MPFVTLEPKLKGISFDIKFAIFSRCEISILPLELANEWKTSHFKPFLYQNNTYSLSNSFNLCLKIHPWLNDVINYVLMLIISSIPVGLGSERYRMVSDLTGLEYFGALGFFWVHLASLTLSKLWTCIEGWIYFHISYRGDWVCMFTCLVLHA